MSLLHFAREAGDDVVALECHSCRRRHVGADLAYALEVDELQCRDCGAGGMIAHRHGSVEGRFPEPLCDDYVPIPNALMKHHAALGIGPNELLVIWALESYRRAMGDIVWPSPETVAAQIGLGLRTVERSLSRLRKLRLVAWTPGAKKHGSGGREPNRYDLDPLWNRLAELVNTEVDRQCGGQVVGVDRHIGGQVNTAHDYTGLTAKSAGVDRQIGGGLTAKLAEEVDVVEVDVLEVDPVGTAPAQAPPHAHAGDDPLGPSETDDDGNGGIRTDDTSAEWADFQKWWQVEHPKLTVSAAWKRWETEHAA